MSVTGPPAEVDERVVDQKLLDLVAEHSREVLEVDENAGRFVPEYCELSRSTSDFGTPFPIREFIQGLEQKERTRSKLGLSCICRWKPALLSVSSTTLECWK